MTRVVFLPVLLLASVAAAQTCPSRAGAAVRSDEARLKFLSSQLAAESARARTWTLAWGATYSVLTLAQVAVVPWILENDKVEWYVAAATTAAGLAFTIGDPLEVLEAGPAYAARAAAPADLCAIILEGEGLLERSAHHEARSRRWYIHGFNVGINVGIGVLLALVYDKWIAGLVNIAIGVALGELTILTSPTRLISAWAEYQRGELGEAPQVTFNVFPLVTPQGAGLGVALRF